jgi:hypothetical protein
MALNRNLLILRRYVEKYKGRKASGKTDTVGFSHSPKLYTSRFHSHFRCVLFFSTSQRHMGHMRQDFLSLLSYSCFFSTYLKHLYAATKTALSQDSKKRNTEWRLPNLGFLLDQSQKFSLILDSIQKGILINQLKNTHHNSAKWIPKPSSLWEVGSSVEPRDPIGMIFQKTMFLLYMLQCTHTQHSNFKSYLPITLVID